MIRNFACLLLALLNIAATATALSACRAQGAKQTQLTVFAAASLTDVFTEIGQAFESRDPRVKVSFNFASSSDLALQLAEGAKADLFASANHKQMDSAVQVGRIGEGIKIFATNRLVIIVPADNPANLQAPIDLSKQELKLVLAAPNVPVRDYAEEVLDKMAADLAYGNGFKAAVLANLVSEEATVRQVVVKVSLGEADAGIVYSSDVTPDAAESVLRIEIPDEFNATASYPIAAIKESPNAGLAKAFIDFVLSQDGQAILWEWGFGPAIIE
jgi:molybdate transport system substrate-binding protein